MFRTKAALSIIVAVVIVMASVAPAFAQSTSGAVCAQTHVVQRGETLSRIARTYGVTIANLQGWNGIVNPNKIYAGTNLCVKVSYPNQGGTTYIVQKGDTLAAIARRYGVNMNVLAQVNNIVNVNRIYVGQVLVIPDVTIQPV
jgi:LysM repeat protein